MDVESSSVVSAAPTTTPIGLGTTDGGYLCAVVKAERPEGTESPLSATEHCAADGMALASAEAVSSSSSPADALEVAKHSADSGDEEVVGNSGTLCVKVRPREIRHRPPRTYWRE